MTSDMTLVDGAFGADAQSAEFVRRVSDATPL
jgi:hypothetical protein